MNDLKLIKKHYGEKMMHLCRELFPTILETEGKLFSIISEHFAHSRFLYEDIINNHMEVEFKDYIFSFIDVSKKEDQKELIQTPKELLDEAGYELFECHNEEEIQAFKKYYAKDEELCTFRGGRLERCYVFFAVKKDVNKIRREDFTSPKRQDEYGTSVISIQFTKDSSNTLSIKNRYNHTVNNPDATFSNDLDNIIPGLTESFNEHYHLHANRGIKGFELPWYVRAKDGKYYRFNDEKDNRYYCPNNIIIDNFEVHEYNKSQYLVMDMFVLDLTKKKFFSNVRERYYEIDSSTRAFMKSIGTIDSIRIENEKNTGNKDVIINDDIIIGINNKNQIIKYINNKVDEIENGFLAENRTLEYLELNRVEKIGNFFLYHNMMLKELKLPTVVRIGRRALYSDESLERIYLPKVRQIDHEFARNTPDLTSAYLPLLEYIGEESFYHTGLEMIDLPSVKYIPANVFSHAPNLRILNIPKATEINHRAVMFVKNLEKINADNVEIIGKNVLYGAEKLKKVGFPKATVVGDAFLLQATDIEEVYMPNINEESYNMLRDHIKNALIGYERGTKL